MLILPVEHLPNTLSSPPECEIELVRFQKSLKLYFENQGKRVVFFEWAYVQGTHANLQVKRKLPSVYLLQVCETEVPKLFCSLGFQLQGSQLLLCLVIFSVCILYFLFLLLLKNSTCDFFSYINSISMILSSCFWLPHFVYSFAIC